MGIMKPHIIQDGARFHVPSWFVLEGPRGTISVTKCSEPLCVMNFLAAEKIERVGIDPAKYVPDASRARGESPSEEKKEG